MDFRIFIEPHNGATYAHQLLLAQAAEKLGFDGYFRSDHYVTMDDRNGGMPGPTDSWTTFTGLAREKSTICLGTLVSSAIFRHLGNRPRHSPQNLRANTMLVLPRLPPLKERIDRVRAACEHYDRDPESLILSIAGTTAVGATETQIEARATAADSTPDKLRAGGFAGAASEVVDKISGLHALGFTRLYFQVMDFHDLDQLDFLAREIIPQLD